MTIYGTFFFSNLYIILYNWYVYVEYKKNVMYFKEMLLMLFEQGYLSMLFYTLNDFFIYNFYTLSNEDKYRFR